jgi:hypothetical protein
MRDHPGPKKLFSRAKVRSMNWSTITNCPGAISSRSDPTAEIAMMSVQPARFSASTLARALTSDGGRRCPRPWRGRKTNSTAPIRPVSNWSDGSPHGVSTEIHRASSSASIAYSPEPPMTPIFQPVMLP